MPAIYLMTWEPKQRLWRKMYKGKRYVVSCRQLGAPENKEGSYQAANAWWLAKLLEVEGQPTKHPNAEVIAEVTRRRDWARRYGEQELAVRLSQILGYLESLPVPCQLGDFTASVDPGLESERGVRG